MASLGAAWILFPAVLGAVSLGCGRLVLAACRCDVPVVLQVPLGFAFIVVCSSLTALASATAFLTTPVVVVAAVAGLVWFRPIVPPLDRWALATAGSVFAVYAAPIVLSGTATFAGYLTLDDTATWLALTDNVMVRGHSVSGLDVSTFQTVLSDDNPGYPLGAFLPLGIGHELTGVDVAWLFQPLIAFLAVLLSLSLYHIASGAIVRRSLAAGVAVVGSQAALLFAYGYWSGLKELASAALLALLAALTVFALREDATMRTCALLVFPAAALLDVLSVGGIVWLVASACAVLLLTRGRKHRPLMLVSLPGVLGLLAMPAVIHARTFLRSADASDVSSSGDIGASNLLRPLNPLQVFGVWPSGDFRFRPEEATVAYALVALAALGCLATCARAFGKKRETLGLVFYLAAAFVGVLAIVELEWLGHGSAWLDGKAFAIASPAVLTCALAGLAMRLSHRANGITAGLALAALVGGVLWSNALAYGNVWLAPRSQLAELETIGKRFAGSGPALMTEYQPYGVRHFLRKLDPEGASERRFRYVSLRAGGYLAKGEFANIDAFALPDILVYRTLVLRRSALESRPPGTYSLVWTGDYYEVWQREAVLAPPIAHLPLGTADSPMGVPVCSDVERLAEIAASSGAVLSTAVRPAPVVTSLSSGVVPPGWSEVGGGSVVPSASGAVRVTVVLPKTGTYGFWLAGSFRGTVRISVDGGQLGGRTGQLSASNQAVPFASRSLSAGAHRVSISYSRSLVAPGQGSYPFGFGPLEIGQPAGQSRVVVVAPAKARTLCGQRLDWIEVTPRPHG